MAHVEKLTMGALAGLDRHCARKNKNYGNESIDKTRTPLNYSLDGHESPIEYFKQRLSEVRMNQKRDDIKVAASWAVTQPRDIQPDESEKFFKAVHNFLSKRYGEKNVVWSQVHMDENTPHLHFCFVPVVADKKHPGQEKVCAKDVLNREELKRFHSDLSKEMENVFGRSVGIETGMTKNNFTVEQLKVKTKIDETVQMLEAKKDELDKVNANRKVIKNAQGLAKQIVDASKKVPMSGKILIDGDLLDKGIECIWNSGGKDEEIEKLKNKIHNISRDLEFAQQNIKMHQSNNLDVRKLHDRVREAETTAQQANKILDAVEEVSPGIVKRAIEKIKDRGFTR